MRKAALRLPSRSSEQGPVDTARAGGWWNGPAVGGTAAQWQGVCWLCYQRSGSPVPYVQASRRWLSIGDAEPSITELAHTVVEAVDAICASSSFDVVGHQAGASVAMHVALTYPQRVRRLVLWGIPILETPWREQLLQPQLPQPPDTRKDHPAAVPQSLHNRFPGEMQGWPVQARAVVEMLQMGEERAWLIKAAAAMDHEVALHAIQQPVLCMAGDSEAFQAATMRAASILPRGRYWHLRDGGIDVVDRYPEEYTRLIVDFLLKH
eukprot:SM000074S21686  [mRNA]  locus=s74:443197:444583:+ [translate_table: standard]